MEISNEINNLKVYYFGRKITNNQKLYINSIIKSIEENSQLLVEFPPTLDKDYLLLSTLFSFCHLKNMKFVMLIHNYDKMNEYLKMIKSICAIRRKFYIKTNVKVHPLFDRKLSCLNDIVLEKGIYYIV